MNTSNSFQEDGPIHYTKFSQTDFRQKGCQGVRKTKMRNGGRDLFAFLNFRARIKIRVSTFDTNHSVTDSTQTINRYSNQQLPGSVVHSVSTADHRGSMCQVIQSGYRSA
jgi:hypothetical protein